MGGEVVGVLLAAGASSRFGGDKLLHALDDGLPLALHSARKLHAVLPRCVAVVRDEHSQLARLLREEGMRTVGCCGEGEGMGTSLARGVAAESQAAGWVVCLGDMPFIKSSTIAAVAQALADGAALAAPVHAGRRCHPVGFHQRFRDDLLALKGDVGARGLVAAHAEQLVLIPCDDAGVSLDVDVPADLDGARGLG